MNKCKSFIKQSYNGSLGLNCGHDALIMYTSGLYSLAFSTYEMDLLTWKHFHKEGPCSILNSLKQVVVRRECHLWCKNTLTSCSEIVSPVLTCINEITRLAQNSASPPIASRTRAALKGANFSDLVMLCGFLNCPWFMQLSLLIANIHKNCQ